MADIALARKVLDHIERFPGHHDQADWVTGAPVDEVAAGNGDHPACGTALCFAGWTAFLTAPKGSRISRGGMDLPAARQDDHAADWTTEQLDLDDTAGQPGALFYAAKTRGDLKAMIDAIEADPHADWRELAHAAATVADEDMVRAGLHGQPPESGS
jgi:hypothetical protein